MQKNSQEQVMIPDSMLKNDLQYQSAIEIYQNSQQELDKVMKEIMSIDSFETWNEKIGEYIKNMEILKKFFYLEAFSKNEKFKKIILKKIDAFIEESQECELQIAVVGAIKAGKSTLLNALLDEELASTSVTPETATLTKFKKSKGKNYLKVSFYTSLEWDEIWKSVKKSKSTIFLDEFNKLNAISEKINWLNKEEHYFEYDNITILKEDLKNWTSSKSGIHYFVKEVTVGLNKFKFPSEIVFVDTPGLDDPVVFRSSITKEYINRANSVLVCVKSDSLTGNELYTIYGVLDNTSYNKEKVYIVGTQLDNLNRPEENWKEQKIEWVKSLKQNTAFGSENLAEKNIIGTAAYLYTLASNFQKLDEQDKFLLSANGMRYGVYPDRTEMELEKLKTCSKIDELRSKINNEIASKFQLILLEDTSAKYHNILSELEEKFTNMLQDKEEILTNINDGIEELLKKISKMKNEINDLNEHKKEIEEFLNDITISTEKRANELYETIKKIKGNI